MTRRAARALALSGAALALAAPAGWAAIPSAEQVRGAVARANAEAGRTRPLWLDVAVVDAAGAVAATGRARLDPDGRARLELRLGDGRSEVHERDPAGYRVARDGARVDRAPRLLPPNQLLQAGTDVEVAAALIGLRGDPDVVDLGPEGLFDCWVLGGREPARFEDNDRPSLWIDIDSRAPVRIDAGAGTHYRFGPLARHGAVMFPSWIEVESRGWPRWRLEVRGVAPAPRPITNP